MARKKHYTRDGTAFYKMSIDVYLPVAAIDFLKRKSGLSLTKTIHEVWQQWYRHLLHNIDPGTETFIGISDGNIHISEIGEGYDTIESQLPDHFDDGEGRPFYVTL